MNVWQVSAWRFGRIVQTGSRQRHGLELTDLPGPPTM